MYAESQLDTAVLYENIRAFLGTGFADFISREDHGTRKVLGESIANSAYYIILFQVFVSSIIKRFKAIPVVTTGLVIIAAGYICMGLAMSLAPSWFLAGVFLFAVGEMTASPRMACAKGEGRVVYGHQFSGHGDRWLIERLCPHPFIRIFQKPFSFRDHVVLPGRLHDNFSHHH
jgi:hypothetical protein